MTERGATSLERDATTLRIGPSRLHWNGSALAIEIDERGAPWPHRLRGRVLVTPLALHAERHRLDAAGRHHWQPIAPRARVEVDLDLPRLSWSGPGYLDHNAGSEPLAAAFRRWHWSRARIGGPAADGDSAVLYDIERRDGSPLTLALRYPADGGAAVPFPPPPRLALPRSAWRIERATRSDGPAAVERTLEDGPFYARSVVASTLLGAPAVAMHESLDLDRFTSPWVQAMLPFRMPRRG